MQSADNGSECLYSKRFDKTTKSTPERPATLRRSTRTRAIQKQVSSDSDDDEDLVADLNAAFGDESDEDFMPDVAKSSAYDRAGPVDLIASTSKAAAKAAPRRTRKAPAATRQSVVKAKADSALLASRKKAAKAKRRKSSDDDSSSSESDWEDVDDLDDGAGVPTESIELEFGADGQAKNAKRQLSAEELIIQRLRKVNRQIQTDRHKVHLLCLIAHGRYVMQHVVQNPHLQAFALSRIARDMHYKAPVPLATLNRLCRQMDKAFPIQRKGNYVRSPLAVTMMRLLQGCASASTSVYQRSILFALVMSSLGFDVRLVWNMHPLEIRPWLQKKALSKRKANVKPKEVKSSPYFSDSAKAAVADDVINDANGSLPPSVKEPTTSDSASSTGSIEVVEQHHAEFSDGDFWLEVYCSQPNGYVTVDCLRGHVREEQERMEDDATMPLRYVLAIDLDGRVKDVTARYAAEWLNKNRKLPIDRVWFQRALSKFRPLDHQKDDDDDKIMKMALLRKPMPTRKSEIQVHPLYLLRGQLKQYEALYPNDVGPVGYLAKASSSKTSGNGEPIYSRDCVRQLHAREKWVQEARTVKLNEEPYKVLMKKPTGRQGVRRRRASDDPNAMLSSTIESKALRRVELFGRWQTEPYKPPVAKDGIVPTNAYGNVDLFFESMLPIGCALLPQLSGLERIARRLGINIAKAMRGWDTKRGWSFPIFDGFVVCKESEDVLLDAWNEEQVRKIFTFGVVLLKLLLYRTRPFRKRALRALNERSITGGASSGA